MTQVRFGLQARFLVVMALTLLLVGAILASLLQRQSAMQREVRGLSAQILHELFDRSLRTRGETLATELASGLADPLYYSDLGAVGALVRNASRQHVVSYVLVFDRHGRLVHDGTPTLQRYGQAMTDPLAAKALAAQAMVLQYSPEVLDVMVPIKIGDQRIGGVRVGMSRERVRKIESGANLTLVQNLNAIGKRDLGWLLVLLASLVGLGVLLAIYVQRTLVAPVRLLAAAAKQIERGDYAVQLPPHPRNDEIGELISAFGRMSESIARHDREVRHMAYTDALTGLTNRLGFREGLDHLLNTARSTGSKLALLFADIDDFKRVNDTLGHEAGDEALLQFASRIGRAVAALGGDDAILARFGGDEFVILLQSGDVSLLAAQLAERLVNELSRPLNVQGREVFLGTSIGITLFPDDARDASALLKNGDIAMYQAKVAGKNCHRFYSRAADHAVERRVHMEHELRGAWERDELRLVYQPIYRTRDRVLVGVEVLLRWQHPALGTIAPSTFIDIAEQSGLIEVIGPKVLRAACLEAAQWPLVGEGLFIAVNVSPRQLRSGDLIDTVAECLAESGLPAARLHLELTETAVIGDEMMAASLLDQLHRTGVKVWLDDFGTGFSGLSHLRQVPVDGVKIDKSFIADLQRDPDDLALTTAIINMAHSLGITVVAEGIEQEAQFNLLRERGCDLGQGYWFSRPLSSADMVKLIAAG
ncbi:putative bifunctional diguanylate cyclase/phosphodiesterase [Xanthomonas vasicola]|uniref:EAL domain-containing protein n=2 Tax=Xanthomonas vasicola TaxID=56459 RepID=A0ABD7SFS3_XANVA|nr:EAL domain-containing protein [Xanthomonas vasicola]AZR23116.1 EAL domain-containing protein [Xanthomonas vasicola]KGR43125.1 DeoR faimly transcriptional regulator [Xanthomonas vasicola]KGR43944.1 DeoR faimly transcriptional regulator [Xanthomonas vasicola]KGR59964.1 DeoR faimly transcriptional regulator [Xanthomonas vasicola]MDO6983459.1 EAL domain-containing protein [Xanthomonas vasicola]